MAFVIEEPGLVPLLAPLEAQSRYRLHFDFSGRHWPAFQVQRQADYERLFIVLGIWKSWFWPFYGSALRSDGPNQGCNLLLLLTAPCYALVQGTFLQPLWARQVLFSCMESGTAARESAAHSLIHESKEEHLQSGRWHVWHMWQGKGI